jgi:hypothetical protein
MVNLFKTFRLTSWRPCRADDGCLDGAKFVMLASQIPFDRARNACGIVRHFDIVAKAGGSGSD